MIQFFQRNVWSSFNVFCFDYLGQIGRNLKSIRFLRLHLKRKQASHFTITRTTVDFECQLLNYYHNTRQWRRVLLHWSKRFHVFMFEFQSFRNSCLTCGDHMLSETVFRNTLERKVLPGSCLFATPWFYWRYRLPQEWKNHGNSWDTEDKYWQNV